MDLKKTPLTDQHERLGAKLAPFGGWLMPIQYSGIISEHNWTRGEVSLFDICHMGEFIISGDAEKSALDRIVTLDVKSLKTGQCRYGFMLNEAGGILDDIIVYRLGAREWMVVTNAATIESDEAHLRKHLSSDAGIKNVSSALGKLDLQGPRSLDVIKKLVAPGVANLGYYKFGHFDLLGERVIISRTGYTGELGFEIYISSGKVSDLWDLLLKDSKARPAGLGARDTLRLEMAYPLYGQDITAETTPLEADKGRFVDLNKDFIGKDALVKNSDPSRRLINIITKSRRSPRHNYGIFYSGKPVGTVTSGSFSPCLSCGIGMGYVSAPCSVGSEILLKDGDLEIAATVTKGPFYKKGTAKLSEGSHAHTG